MTYQDDKPFLTYVTQEDVKNEILSAKELIEMVVELRYDGESEESKEARINKIFREMQLEKCADIYFGGDEHKGLSRGEKKRTCIASKLVIDSPIILLDEPTSGLDSSTSYVIIKYLRNYAKANNKIVLVTIHQPSSNIFSLFDKLIIMNNAKIIYQDSPEKLTDYFQLRGAKMIQEQNPADSFMRALEKFNRYEDKKTLFANEYQNLRESEVNNEIEVYLGKENTLKCQSETYSSFSTAVRVLSKEKFRSVARNPFFFRVRIFNLLVFAFIIGSMFWKLQNTNEGNRGKIGVTLFLTASTFMQNVVAVVTKFHKERFILKDEYNSNLYGVVPFYFAKQLVELPLTQIVNLLYVAIVYFMIGFKETAVNFFILLGTFQAYTFLCIAIAYIIGILSNDINAAQKYLLVLAMSCFLFSGLLLTPSNMPVWLAWIRYLNPIYYNAQAMMRNEFEDYTFKGFNVYKMLYENLEIYQCVVILICLAVFLRVLLFVGAKLAVLKKI